jgi:thymidylate synthase
MIQDIVSVINLKEHSKRVVMSMYEDNSLIKHDREQVPCIVLIFFFKYLSRKTIQEFQSQREAITEKK